MNALISQLGIYH